MTKKVIAPKPGLYKGVKYRSQLEIKWAKYFDEHDCWFKYRDEGCYDFSLQPWVFVYENLEVKPKCSDLVVGALTKWLAIYDEAEDGPQLGIFASVLVGAPPSRYGFPSILTATRIEFGHVLLLASTFHGLGCCGSQQYMLLYDRSWFVCPTEKELAISVIDWLFGEDGEPSDET